MKYKAMLKSELAAQASTTMSSQWSTPNCSASASVSPEGLTQLAEAEVGNVEDVEDLKAASSTM